MSKIICDVCGTRYPESAEQCPICGRVRADGGNTAVDDILMDEAPVSGGATRVRGGRFSKSNVRKRNQNLVRYEAPEEKPRTRTRSAEDEDDAYGVMESPKRKSNVGLNIALVIVIVALLCVTGYIFVEYFLPNILHLQEETLPSTEPAVVATEAPTEGITEEPTIPCTGLESADGQEFVILGPVGQQWLLNVVVTPADTTDELIYYSTNEAVVTVDSEGCLTAVGGGEAVVVVTCGSIELEYNVQCIIEEDEDSTVEATEEPTEAPTEAPTEPLKDVTLTVNLTDITFNAKNQGYTFKCSGLSNDEVTWISEDESIVTVEDGKAISVGRGTTNIIAKYGEQEVTIIVRCDF